MKKYPLAATEPSAVDADEDVFAAAGAAMRAGSPLRHPVLKQAAELLREKQAESAEALLSPFLVTHPNDAGGVRLMAQVCFANGKKEEAGGYFARAAALAPGDAAIRYEYANALFQLNRPTFALAEIDRLLQSDPHNPLCLDLKSIVLSAMGRHAESLACYRTLAEDHLHSAEIMMKYGWSLRSVGRRDDCIAALRKAIDLRPSCGEAYWSLSRLTGFSFLDDDMLAMEQQLSDPSVAGENRMYFHFALGKGLADRKLYAKAFENYARANALKRLTLDYDPAWLSRNVVKFKALFTPEFLEGHIGSGSGAFDPIFIVGMQRAGSTLVEQILASHSAIESTAELPEISLLAEHIGERIAPEYGEEYPGVLARIGPQAFREFGERYLESTRFRRTPGCPHFTDKMPYNFLHVGLIHLMLPNAKIVDVRRNPLGCCFSNFSMNFKFGALFAYRLNELGQAYRDYVELMAHFDSVLPSRVHRVIYDDLVQDPETHVRRLLDHIGLPFDAACLRFHENARAMDSASSEQVRKPISTEAVAEWRNYEAWLGPLKTALGPALENWRGSS